MTKIERSRPRGPQKKRLTRWGTFANGYADAYWVVSDGGWCGGPYTEQTIAAEIARVLRRAYPNLKFTITSSDPT